MHFTNEHEFKLFLTRRSGQAMPFDPSLAYFTLVLAVDVKQRAIWYPKLILKVSRSDWVSISFREDLRLVQDPMLRSKIAPFVESWYTWEENWTLHTTDQKIVSPARDVKWREHKVYLAEQLGATSYVLKSPLCILMSFPLFSLQFLSDYTPRILNEQFRPTKLATDARHNMSVYRAIAETLELYERLCNQKGNPNPET